MQLKMSAVLRYMFWEHKMKANVLLATIGMLLFCSCLRNHDYSFDQMRDAIIKNDLAILRQYIDHSNSNMFVNGQDRSMTLLHVAAEYDRPQMAEYLMKRGIEVDGLPDSFIINYPTPLIRAMWCKSKNTAAYLIRNGANINAQDSYGISILHLAAVNKWDDIALMLLEKKAVINRVNSNGQTPLYIASLNGATNIVKMFIQYGAFINIKDINNKTALEIALENGHDQIVEMLRANRNSAD